jgi:hypothetical protein
VALGPRLPEGQRRLRRSSPHPSARRDDGDAMAPRTPRRQASPPSVATNGAPWIVEDPRCDVLAGRSKVHVLMRQTPCNAGHIGRNPRGAGQRSAVRLGGDVSSPCCPGLSLRSRAGDNACRGRATSARMTVLYKGTVPFGPRKGLEGMRPSLVRRSARVLAGFAWSCSPFNTRCARGPIPRWSPNES